MTTNSQGVDLWQIKGDVPDPTGTGLRGVSSGVDFTKTAAGHPVLFYRGETQDLFLTADVYRLPDAPMQVHLYCGKCGNAIQVSQENKDMHYDTDRIPKFRGMNLKDILVGLWGQNHPNLGPHLLGGTLSVGPFRCTWAHDGSVCGWNVAIDENIIRRI